MIAIELRVHFHLSGCRSLKEKRARLKGLKDRFGKQSGMAVCESDFADEHQRAQWSFVAVAAAAKPVQQMLDEVDRYLQFSVDAQIVDMQRLTLAAPYQSMAAAEAQDGQF